MALGFAALSGEKQAAAQRGCYNGPPRFHGQTWGAPRYRAWAGSPYHRMPYTTANRGMIGGNPRPWR